MDLHAPLTVVERPEGARALIAYAIGLAIGVVVSLPILAALFEVELPIL
jgi:hypothetical protein